MNHLNLYTGFWKRVFAYVIDCVVLFMFLKVAARVFPEQGINYLMYDQMGRPVLSMLEVIDLVIVAAYMILCHCSPLQATVGKLMMRIKVVNFDGGRIGVIRSVFRYVSFMFSAMIFGIGFFMAGVTPRKQALHDMLCGTLVVNR